MCLSEALRGRLLTWLLVSLLLADADKDVRRGLISLLEGRVLPLLEASALRPFLPLVMAHVSRALTHLSMEVRADALDLLEVLLRHDARDVLHGHFAQVLQHYVDMLQQRTAGTVGSRSLKALGKVVASLEAFLGHAERAMSGSAAGASGHLRSGAGPTLMASRCRFAPRTGPSRAQEPAAGPAIAASSGALTAEALLLVQLTGLLLEVWLECAPGQLSTAPEALAAHTLHQAATCLDRALDLLAGQGATDLHLVPMPPAAGEQETGGRRKAKSSSVADAVAGRLALFFPLGVPAVKPPKEVADSLIGANLQMSRLLGRCIPGLALGSSAPPRWVAALATYYRGVLARGEVLPSQGALAELSREWSASAAAYSVALEGCLALLPALDPESRAALLAAAVGLGAKSSPRSSERELSLRLQHRIISDPAGFCGTGLVAESDICRWLAAMPRMLYELAGKRPEVSDLILRSIHTAATLAPVGSLVATTAAGLLPQVAALFAAVLADASGAARVVIGPLAKLPAEIQLLAADLLCFLGPPTEPVLRALAAAALSPQYPAALGERLLHAALSQVDQLPPSLVLSFAATVVLGRASGVSGAPLRARLVQLSCRGLVRAGVSPLDLAELLLPLLSAASDDVRARRGALVALQFSLGGAELPLRLGQGLREVAADLLASEILTGPAEDAELPRLPLLVDLCCADVAMLGELAQRLGKTGTVASLPSALALLEAAVMDSRLRPILQRSSAHQDAVVKLATSSASREHGSGEQAVKAAALRLRGALDLVLKA